MPFLVVKKGDDIPLRVDIEQVKSLLAPYSGQLGKRSFPNYEIYFTEWCTEVFEDSLWGLNVFGPNRTASQICAQATLRFKKDEVIFTTDRMAIFPIWRWQASNFEAWSPEAKSFLAIHGSDALTWKSDQEILAIKKRSPNFSPFTNVERILESSIYPLRALKIDSRNAEQTKAHIVCAFKNSFASLPKVQARTVFLSGGIDSSSVLGFGILETGHFKYQALSLGTSLGNEFAEAQEFSTSCKVPLLKIHFDESTLQSQIEDIVFRCEVVDGMTLEILLQLNCLLKKATSLALTGYGSDLLFGGMLRHEAYLKAVGVNSTLNLIERTVWTGELSPFLAWHHNCVSVSPYWSPEFVSLALQLRSEDHFDGSHEKVLLRQTAVESGWVSSEFAYRKKLGMTNGTRFNEIVSRHFGLCDGYAYAEKSKKTLALLKTLFSEKLTK